MTLEKHIINDNSDNNRTRNYDNRQRMITPSNRGRDSVMNPSELHQSVRNMMANTREYSNPSLRIHLTWRDVHFWIPIPRSIKEKLKDLKGKNIQEKEILRGVSGASKPCEIIGIMGSSGAGKTTLLNVLAGRVIKSRITGDIRINDSKRDANWKRIVAFVEQDDVMYRTLTVREIIQFSATLKLPHQIGREEKRKRVDSVLKVLGLEPVADSKIGDAEHRGISGGERKRVSIGIELVKDPRLIFLDEPTSGLDAFTAQSVVESVSNLARRDHRTVIMTIHQPRTEILESFDKILLLSQGKTIFFGSLGDSLNFFRQNGLECPQMENPADFFLDQITIDNRTREGLESSQSRVNMLHDSWNKIESQMLRSESLHYSAISPSFETTVNNNMDTEGGKKRKGSSWPNPYFIEFTTLLKRDFTNQFRDVHTIIAEIVQIIVLFLLLGFVFFQMPTEGFAAVQDRIGLLFFIPVNQSFLIIQPLIVIFALDRQIILRERYSATYRISAAYFSKFISLLPLRFVLSTCFATGLYYLTGLRTDGFQYFLIFLGFILLHALCAICLGLLIGAAMPNVQMGQVVGPLILVIFLIFGGNLANADSVTWILRWIQYLSLVFFAYQGLIQNELQGQSFGVISGDQYIEQFALNQVSVMGCAGALMGLSAGFLILGYIALRISTRPRFILI